MLCWAGFPSLIVPMTGVARARSEGNQVKRVKVKSVRLPKKNKVLVGVSVNCLLSNGWTFFFF